IRDPGSSASPPVRPLCYLIAQTRLTTEQKRKRSPARPWPFPSVLAERLEEILHAAEKGARLGCVLLRGEPLELLQQLTLPPGEVLRRLHDGLDIQVAHLRLAQHRHALPPQAELATALRTFGHLHTGLGT